MVKIAPYKLSVPISSPPLVYTVNHVMPLLKLSRNSVHKLLSTGALASVRCGRKYLIPVDAVQRYLTSPADTFNE